MTRVFLFLAGALVCLTALGAAHAAAADTKDALQTATAEQRAASIKVRDDFVAAARRGDVDAMVSLLTPRATAGDAALAKKRMAQEIVPFFERYALNAQGGTEARAADLLDNQEQAQAHPPAQLEGYAYYRFAKAKPQGDPHPYAVWTLYENGRFVIAEVAVNYFVPGRHGSKAIPEKAAPPADGNWLPGMVTQTTVKPKLPEGYVIVPLAEAEHWNLQEGVAWCAPEAAGWARGIRDKAQQGVDPGPEPDAPMMTAWLSSTVGYLAQEDTFSVEEALRQAKAEQQDLTFKIERRHWGSYPVLAYTATDARGNQRRTAWVGIGSGTWVVELNSTQAGEKADRFFWDVIEHSGEGKP